jgi:hypothetical protein
MFLSSSILGRRRFKFITPESTDVSTPVASRDHSWGSGRREGRLSSKIDEDASNPALLI